MRRSLPAVSCALRYPRASPSILGVGGVLLAGCSSVPVTTAPAPPQEAMFPTLKLNDDLFKSLKPSNNRDWTPEQAVLAQGRVSRAAK